MFLAIPAFADTMPFYINSIPKGMLGLYQTDKEITLYSHPESKSQVIKKMDFSYNPESMPDNVFALLINEKKLGFLYVNSGLVYRIITYSLLSNKQDLSQITLHEFNKLQTSLHDLITTKFNDVLTAKMLTPSYLLSEEVAVNTSKIAKLPFVREFANKIFFDIAKKYNIIIDGRDMGSVVFKNAFLKFYLEASIPTRAYRRYMQLQEKHQVADLAKITLEMKNRDESDKKRSIAPLVIPENAIVIDTDQLSIDEVANLMFKHYQTKLQHH